MSKRLVLAAVSILVLPIGFSAVQRSGLEHSLPFATTALAGHTAGGLRCEPCTSGCIPDPGEPACNNASPVDGTRPSDHVATPVSADGTSEFDLGSGALMLALAFMLWMRRLV
ncbi:MAG TPA: hypothetical protein VJH03_18700 [Blastocatellia bacterium]|nr:hypothetical protein [Blastocatellia bacterium]